MLLPARITLLRILVADDHEAVRKGIRAILSTRPDVEQCHEAANGLEAIEKPGN